MGENGQGTSGDADIVEVVAEIWTEVLGVDDIGRDIDFFSLGGDSVLAVRVLARVNSQFYIDIPVVKLFEGEMTVEEMAKAIKAEIQIRNENADRR